MGLTELTVLKNIVRVGTVSSIDQSTRTARVKFTDKKNLISGPLKILKCSPVISIQTVSDHTHETTIKPWIPSIGELVLCIYLPNGGSDGFIIGGI
ncbi:hypothetical protein [Vallitalea guaymasensis]|uniref:hypothetical protein n=1 Tax=Vallitalea guaymasensis TaxID=1185412 RepID=UPI000DE1E4EC|nr:hypothetical protein [Vallitalea guaymasensis]